MVLKLPPRAGGLNHDCTTLPHILTKGGKDSRPWIPVIPCLHTWPRHKPAGHTLQQSPRHSQIESRKKMEK